MDPFVQDYFVALFGVSKYILRFVMLETKEGEKEGLELNFQSKDNEAMCNLPS